MDHPLLYADRKILWALGIIGFIAGVLWLVGCQAKPIDPKLIQQAHEQFEFYLAHPDCQAAQFINGKYECLFSGPLPGPYRPPVH